MFVFRKIHVSKATILHTGDTFTFDLVEPPVTNSLGEAQQTYLINEMRLQHEVRDDKPSQFLQLLPIVHLASVSVYSQEERPAFQRTSSLCSNSSTQQLYTYLQTWGAPKPFETLAKVKVNNDFNPLRVSTVDENTKVVL